MRSALGDPPSSGEIAFASAAAGTRRLSSRPTTAARRRIRGAGRKARGIVSAAGEGDGPHKRVMTPATSWLSLAIPTLYFELGSPYSYLAAERAGSVLGVEPTLSPLVLGAIFKRRGWGSWRWTDERAAGMAEVERRAREYGLPPVVWPEGWPSNTLSAMRACVWADSRDFVLAAYRAAFVEGRDLSDLSVVAAVASSVGLDGGQLEAAVADPAIKEALRESTDAAWELGVSGAPTLAVDGRLFYGDDQLEAAAAALR